MVQEMYINTCMYNAFQKYAYERPMPIFSKKKVGGRGTVEKTVNIKNVNKFETDF